MDESRQSWLNVQCDKVYTLCIADIERCTIIIILTNLSRTACVTKASRYCLKTFHVRFVVSRMENRIRFPLLFFQPPKHRTKNPLGKIEFRPYHIIISYHASCTCVCFYIQRDSAISIAWFYICKNTRRVNGRHRKQSQIAITATVQLKGKLKINDNH